MGKWRMARVEAHTNTSVRLESPWGDADLIAQGQALAETIKEALASIEATTALDEVMHSLRGRSGLS